MIEPGDAFPDFSLSNQDGETVRLRQLRGRKVVLFAFPKADTPGCTRQACGFRDHWADLQEAGAVVLGISPDPPAALARWKEKQKLPYDLLSDPDHATLDRLGAWGEKSMYGRKYQGVLRSHWVIDEKGRLLDAQVKVSPAKSVESAVGFLAS
ncbi:MAG: thioredoxin-dependent thiol peroxidase [Thermoanaerobaculia bacterium]